MHKSLLYIYVFESVICRYMTLTTVCFSLRDVTVPEVVEEAEPSGSQGGEDLETYTPLTFHDVYCINGATLELFKGTRFV